MTSEDFTPYSQIQISFKSSCKQNYLEIQLGKNKAVTPNSVNLILQ